MPSKPTLIYMEIFMPKFIIILVVYSKQHPNKFAEKLDG